MPVTLVGDLADPGFWRPVADRLYAELAARGLAGWTVTIQETGGSRHGGVEIGRAAKAVAINAAAARDRQLSPAEQAFAWADTIEVMVKGEPGEGWASAG